MGNYQVNIRNYIVIGSMFWTDSCHYLSVDNLQYIGIDLITLNRTWGEKKQPSIPEEEIASNLRWLSFTMRLVLQPTVT